MNIRRNIENRDHGRTPSRAVYKAAGAVASLVVLAGCATPNSSGEDSTNNPDRVVSSGDTMEYVIDSSDIIIVPDELREDLEATIPEEYSEKEDFSPGDLMGLQETISQEGYDTTSIELHSRVYNHFYMLDTDKLGDPLREGITSEEQDEFARKLADGFATRLQALMNLPLTIDPNDELHFESPSDSTNELLTKWSSAFPAFLAELPGSNTNDAEMNRIFNLVFAYSQIGFDVARYYRGEEQPSPLRCAVVVREIEKVVVDDDKIIVIITVRLSDNGGDLQDPSTGMGLNQELEISYIAQADGNSTQLGVGLTGGTYSSPPRPVPITGS